MTLRRSCVVRALGMTVALGSFAAPVIAQGRKPVRQPAATERAGTPNATANGPVAIGLRTPSEAVVLQIDNVVRALDLRTWSNPPTVFEIPPEYQVMDLGAGTFHGAPTICVLVNHRAANDSYLIQNIDGKQIWTLLQPRGIYVGAAFDPVRGFAYVTNSSTGQILQVQIGQNKPPVQVSRIVEDVVRIGSIAVDSQGQRVFAADASSRIFVVTLTTRAVRKLDVPGLDDIRALAWDPSSQRLYVADSGSETVSAMAVDHEGVKPQVVLRDRRFRRPSGVALEQNGSALVTDESANAIVEITPGGTVGRTAMLLAQPGIKKF